MRVLQIAPPWFAVPPQGYGGIEAVVSLLADGLVAAGQQVELLASGGSRSDAELRVVYDEPPSALLGDVAVELGHVLDAYLDPGEVDVIHDHSGLVGPALGALAARVPVVHTLHGPWTDANRRIYHHLAPHLDLVAISRDQARRAPSGVRLAGVVHNGLHLDDYPMRPDKEDFLLWVGRASREKGPEVAVEVARRLGRRLVMAIKINEAAEHAYYREVVEPRMQGVDVEVQRNVQLPVKADLMGRAACVLFPIQWPEPFGLVMIEAMACGTPVVAYANGSAPEVVDDGRTGFLVPEGDVEGLCSAVRAVGAIDPQRCRRRVEERFSAANMVSGYLDVFERAVARHERVTAAAARRRRLERAS